MLASRGQNKPVERTRGTMSWIRVAVSSLDGVFYSNIPWPRWWKVGELPFLMRSLFRLLYNFADKKYVSEEFGITY